MKTKNKLLTLLILSTGAATVTAMINKGIQLNAVSKNVLKDSDPLCFKWRFGDIHYTKKGNGKPLLLIHDLSSDSSSYEWHSLIPKLAETYTVYAIDLLGCGRSEKPNLTYTNYLYVQLISDFIKSEIGHRTDIIATGASASFVIMACSSNPKLFDRLMFINPDSILSCSQISGKRAKLYKFLLDLPIIGSLIYNISVSRKAISDNFRNQYFYNPYSVRQSTLDAYYEAAHLGESPKSIYSSLRCHYTNCNIVNALKKIDNSIYLVGGDSIDFIEELLNEYREYNPAVEYTIIHHTKHLPQLEKPYDVLQAVETYLS